MKSSLGGTGFNSSSEINLAARSRLSDQPSGATRGAAKPEKTDGAARCSWGFDGDNRVVVARRGTVGPLNKQHCEIYPQTITVTL
jgi:hypothetical protein